MSQPERKLVTPVSLAVDAALVLGFFIFMFHVLSPHVQSHDRFYIDLWGCLATACLTGVFWLALQMFRVVLRAHLASRK